MESYTAQQVVDRAKEVFPDKWEDTAALISLFMAKIADIDFINRTLLGFFIAEGVVNSSQYDKEEQRIMLERISKAILDLFAGAKEITAATLVEYNLQNYLLNTHLCNVRMYRSLEDKVKIGLFEKDVNLFRQEIGAAMETASKAYAWQQEQMKP